MPDAPRLLIVAEDDRLAAPLAAGLAGRGWPARIVRGAEGALAATAADAPEAVVIDPAGGAPSLFSLPARLKAAAAPRRLPVLALAAPEPALDALGFDLALGPGLHPVQAALRLESLARTAVSEEEAALRELTFAAAGLPPPPAAPDAPPRPAVLAVGEPSPRFLALRHALEAGGAEVTGAFTAFTAFDFLHDRSFDAAVLWAGETHAEALSIAAGMRRNTRLYHTPAVLLLRDGAEVAAAEAYARGLADMVAADAGEAEAAARVLQLARAHGRERAVRARLEGLRGSRLMDGASGLFTPELFAAHLRRLHAAASERRRPLSVAVLRLEARARSRAQRRERRDAVEAEVGAMLGRLVRAEDTPARLGPGLFAVALPAARAAQAQAAAERLAAVIACTAFSAAADPDAPPVTVSFDLGAAEVDAGESPAAALERAAALASAQAA